jgi:arylformamidase
MGRDEEHYDRAFCERQYDPTTMAPDADDVRRHRLALAADARSRFRVVADVPFGTTPKERVDIYPARGDSRAVMVFIHGGYWQRLDKQDLAFLAASFVPAGVTLVQVNYNLAPAVTIDRIVEEVRGACTWIWHNIGAYGGDRNRIYIGGNSAGGHLTAMMAATDWTKVDDGVPPDLMKGGLAISGIYNLEPIRYTSINDAVRLDRDSAARNSPCHLSPTLRGPLLLPVGELESDEFQRQTRLLAAAWEPLAPKVLPVDGRHHYSILLDLADPGSDLFREALRLMDLQPVNA